MSERSKSKSKSTQTQTKTVKPEDLEKELSALKGLQRLVVVRYSVYLGRKHLMGLKMKELQPELKALKEINKKLSELYEEAESSGRLNVAEVKKLKQLYKKVKEEFNKKAEPYDKRIKPLTRQLRHLDNLIINNPTVKPNLKTILTIDEVPEDLRVPQGGK